MVYMGRPVASTAMDQCIHHISMSSVVLGGDVEVVGSNLARGKIFTASIGSVD